jgi:hypothetical protein
MNFSSKLMIASALLALPVSLLAQSTANNAQNAPKMVGAHGSLVQTLDSKKSTVGSEVKIKLDKAVKLDNGTALPAGTVLVGNVVQDDMSVAGNGKLALRFTHAMLKSGQNVPVRATITGIATNTDDISDALPAGIQKIDRTDVVSNVDLHSKAGSKNSGVFVATKKPDVKINAGSEIQVALSSDVASPDLGTSVGNGN